MKKLLPIACLFLSMNSYALVNPTELKIKVYQVAVSLSSDCSDPQTIFISTAGVETDFLSSPSLGSGSIANGTYNCVMITMEDGISFKPAANDGGSCVANTEYSIDLCRINGSGQADQDYQSYTDLLEGTTTTNTACQGTSQIITGGAGGISNKVTLYLRTTGLDTAHTDAPFVTAWKKGTATALSNDEDGMGSMGPSVDRPHGLQLTSPFVVSGSKTGIFYVDATGKVDGSGGNCELQPPVFGFR